MRGTLVFPRQLIAMPGKMSEFCTSYVGPLLGAIRIACRRNELEPRREKRAVQNSMNRENDTVLRGPLQNYRAKWCGSHDRFGPRNHA